MTFFQSKMLVWIRYHRIRLEMKTEMWGMVGGWWNYNPKSSHSISMPIWRWLLSVATWFLKSPEELNALLLLLYPLPKSSGDPARGAPSTCLYTENFWVQNMKFKAITKCKGRNNSAPPSPPPHFFCGDIDANQLCWEAKPCPMVQVLQGQSRTCGSLPWSCFSGCCLSHQLFQRSVCCLAKADFLPTPCWSEQSQFQQTELSKRAKKLCVGTNSECGTTGLYREKKIPPYSKWLCLHTYLIQLYKCGTLNIS